VAPQLQERSPDVDAEFFAGPCRTDGREVRQAFDAEVGALASILPRVTTGMQRMRSASSIAQSSMERRLVTGDHVISTLIQRRCNRLEIEMSGAANRIIPDAYGRDHVSTKAPLFHVSTLQRPPPGPPPRGKIYHPERSR
jgi:hypothetical protein